MHFNREVNKAKMDDELPTTHPIEATCISSIEAEQLIDGITYGKGAAFVKLLMLQIGQEKFVHGCRIYFKKYAWLNCTLDGFIDCMQIASGKDLLSFSNSWAKTKGLIEYTAVLTDDNL